jgi:hypothetical protein
VSSIITNPGGGGSGDGAGVRQDFRGLYWLTHPDADKAASQILVVRADEVIFDDGFRLAAGIARLVADITASGAGGLDTGAEAAAKWYELHLIRKSSDGTLSTLLHRAREYVADQSQTTANGGGVIRAGAADRVKLAQSFQPATAGPCDFVDVRLNRLGSPVGEVWFTIEADSGSDAPSGTPLATSDRLNAAAFSTTDTFVRFPFRAPATLAAGTKYWLVAQASYTASTSNHIKWQGNTSSSTYANGRASAFNGTTWGSTPNPDGQHDMAFKTYATVESAVVMPSGYDQRCHLGFAYNDASGNFRLQSVVDRLSHSTEITLASGIANATSTPLLIHSAEGLPPVPVKARPGIFASADADVFAVVGGITGFLFSSFNRFVGSGVGGGFAFDYGAFVNTEYQTLYACRVSGAGTGTITAFGWEW